MARSKPPRKRATTPQPTPPTKERRAARARVFKSIAEILRNLGLLLFGAPLVEPIINPEEAFNPASVGLAMGMGLALIVVSLTLDYLRRDEP